MPCPEKFKESLVKFEVSDSIIHSINSGYDDIVSSTPKKIRAAYFKHAMDVFDEKLDFDKKREILDWNACCKSGSRDKASKAFAKENSGIPLKEKLEKVKNVPYMGKPVLNGDGTITILAVEYLENGKYACACTNFNKLKRDYSVSKTYCLCCCGHFRYHYQKMLDIKLKLREVVSSPLDSDGKYPCVLNFEIV
ncbi:hypothetical protein JYG23_13760 [Sedimentibacter sp. zth1]|uniref:hypothetical protein n=1 Tax=Sedimentibacter sp. zth1 TaxID=2816908 RepID=UPI001A91FE8A|nr:hypothetical protein [Sedimentibacter sp. zth1]QSX05712.1 hypothetical protein JYG23_13760 [Sedimentibacter sp. zth1]